MEYKTPEERIAALRALIEDQKRELAELDDRLKAELKRADKGTRKGPEDGA